ncbi:MAG: class I SAM-dependent methyltransferase [Acidimicrobiales bacterium]
MPSSADGHLPRESHYFDPEPGTTSRRRTVVVSLPDRHLRMASDRGVFSADRLDPGTKLLLLEAPPLAHESAVLDLGCGWGAIACVVAQRAPDATVWAIDVNRRALHLTEHNAAALGLTNVNVATPDEVDAGLRFDRLLSNPPIRIGKTALHELLVRWLGRLGPGGLAHLVVQRHLGADSLASWLEGRGHPVGRLTSRAGYRLLEVGPSPPPENRP